MTYRTSFSIRRAGLLLLALPLATSALAQSKPDRAERKAERVERFAETLNLTAAQRQILAEAEAEPGALWNVAAALAPTLSDAQRAALFARPERRNARGERKRGRRGDRATGDRPERREASHEAMHSALNLTDAQVAELEARHAARQVEREQRMQDRTAGELPDDLASILTPAQQEVFKVHRALAMRMHHGRHRGGRRGR